MAEQDEQDDGSTKDDQTESSILRSTSVLRSFLAMCICFSANHACVTTVLGLASAELGDTLGGYSSGTLFVCYTLTALCGATLIVDLLGATTIMCKGRWKSASRLLGLAASSMCLHVIL